MAITSVTGLQGTGKTYYAVHLLWKNFVDSNNKKTDISYENAFTNINGFDFDISDKINKLNFNDIKESISELHQMYMNGSDDDELNERAKELNLYKTLFVIDEASNFFNKVDDVLIWWFTYHRHMYQEIILLTVDLAHIKKEYFAVTQHFYKSVPSEFILRQNKNFKYIKNRTAKFYKTDKLGEVTVPKLDDVFNMYVSGDSNKGKSLYNRLFLIAGVGGFVLILFIYIVFTMMFSSDKEDTPTAPQIQNKKQSKIKTKKIDDLNVAAYTFYCFKNNQCSYKDYHFPKKFLISTIKKLKPEQFYIYSYGNSEKYNILAQKDTFDFLNIPKKGVIEDVKKNNPISSLNIF